MAELEQRLIDPYPASHPELGTWLWAMEDARERTRLAVEGITRQELDWAGAGIENTIGSLLYHIGLIEFDYLCVDILGGDYLDGFDEVLPFPDRDESGRLSVVTGVSLEDHLARLDTIREEFLARVSVLTAAQMSAPRKLDTYGYVISPAWTLHHLMQHEAGHRGQIEALRSLMRQVE